MVPALRARKPCHLSRSAGRQREDVLLNLSAATVGHSNLGGLGPNFSSPPTLAFRSVGVAHNGRAIDLLVSNLSAYVPRNTASNGITNGHLGVARRSLFLFWSFLILYFRWSLCYILVPRYGLSVIYFKLD